MKLHHYEPSNNSINAAGAAINLRRRELEHSDKLFIVEIRLPCCVTFENLTLDIWHFLQSKTDVIEESVRTVGALVLSRSDQPGSASQVRSANIIRVKYPLLRRPRMWRPAKRNESSKRSPSQVQVGSDESFASPFVRWLHQHASPRTEHGAGQGSHHHASREYPRVHMGNCMPKLGRRYVNWTNCFAVNYRPPKEGDGP